MIVTTFPRSVRVIEHILIPLKDGTTPNGLFTLILRRIDGQWRIVHDHTSSEQ